MTEKSKQKKLEVKIKYFYVIRTAPWKDLPQRISVEPIYSLKIFPFQ